MKVPEKIKINGTLNLSVNYKFYYAGLGAPNDYVSISAKIMGFQTP